MSQSQDALIDKAENQTRRKRRKRGFGGDWLDIFLTLAMVMAAVIAIYSFARQMPKDLQPILLLAGTAALVLGWGAGVMFSPYAGREHLSSRGTGRLLTGLVVGFLVAWFWQPIKAFFASCSPNATGFLSSGLFPVAAIALIIFVLSMVTTYVLRNINQARG